MTPHRTGVRFPASPRSPNRPLSRMGCGGDNRFQSRGRTAVGFYHPAGARLSTCRVFLCPIVGLFSGVPAWVYRRARGCSGDRIVMRTPSEKTTHLSLTSTACLYLPPPIRPRADIGAVGPLLATTSLLKSRICGAADSTRMLCYFDGGIYARNARFEYNIIDVSDSKVFIFALL